MPLNERQIRDLNYLEGIVRKTLEKLWTNDRALIDVNVNERTLSARLFCYLEPNFEGWDIDPEYNRHGDGANDTKEIARWLASELGLAETDRRVLPDIIVHHRRARTDNYLVIEVKKSTSNDTGETDIKKLEALTRHDSDFAYQFGLRLIISMDGNADNNRFE
jgi:hypothetical protein